MVFGDIGHADRLQLFGEHPREVKLLLCAWRCGGIGIGFSVDRDIADEAVDKVLHLVEFYFKDKNGD